MKVEQTHASSPLCSSPPLPVAFFNGLLMRIWRGLGIVIIDSASDPTDLGSDQKIKDPK